MDFNEEFYQDFLTFVSSKNPFDFIDSIALTLPGN